MTDALDDTTPRETLPTGPGRSRMPRLLLAANFALAGLLTALSLAGLVGVTDPSVYIGTVLLVGSILPSNLLRFGRFSHGRRMRALAQLRQPLGISAGVWFVVHSVASVWEYFDLSLPLGPQFARTGILLGLVATLVFVLMLATSTGRAQRTLGANWKRLHRLVWFAVPLSLAHALVTGGGGAAGRCPLRRDHGLRRPLAERIESGEGGYINQVSAAASLTGSQDGADERERAVRASKSVIRPLAAPGPD